MTVVVVDLDSDSEDCERLMRSSKRRHTACPTVISPCDSVDSQLPEPDAEYLRFVRLLDNNDFDQCFLKKDQYVSSEGDDVVDPDYKMFLEKLKADGKSYVLEVELEGTTVLLKYETEGAGGNVLQSEGEPCSVTKPKKLGNMKDTLLKESGQSIRSSKSLGNKSEKMVNTLRRKESEKQSNVRNKSSKEKSIKIRRCPAVEPRESVFRGRNVEAVAKTHSTRPKRCARKEFDKSLDFHDMHDSAADEVVFDESLLAFLKCFGYDGGALVYNPDDGKKVRYEADEEGDGESEVEILDKEDFPQRPDNPFVIAQNTDVINIENDECGPTSYDSEFREKLVSLLKMPYDNEEYNDLMKKVKHRRRKEIGKELRGGREVSYSVKDVCKSYLDSHQDFSRAIKRVKGDRYKTLNLLRGFFFWLNNLPRGGSFCPWLDSYCLNLLPGH